MLCWMRRQCTYPLLLSAAMTWRFEVSLSVVFFTARSTYAFLRTWAYRREDLHFCRCINKWSHVFFLDSRRLPMCHFRVHCAFLRKLWYPRNNLIPTINYKKEYDTVFEIAQCCMHVWYLQSTTSNNYLDLFWSSYPHGETHSFVSVGTILL